MEFVETPTFTRLVLALMDDDTYARLQATLALRPDLGKVISVKYGNSFADLFKGMTGQPPDNPSVKTEGSEVHQEAPKKMRGPKIKAADIRKMSHAKDM
mgnify:CR=1 FL=1